MNRLIGSVAGSGRNVGASQRWPQRVVRVVGILAAVGVVAYLIWQLLLPTAIPRAEIFRGVYLSVETHSRGLFGSSQTVIVEVHLDEPGVSLGLRPYSFEFDSTDADAAHYRLMPADLGLMLRRPAVLANGTRYHPSSLFTHYPGKPVRTVETLVNQGEVSHLHAHSYMIYRFADGSLRLDGFKPPSIPEDAVWGVGVQGIGIYNGTIDGRTDEGIDSIIDRNFVGIDPARRIVWLIATTGTDGHHVLRKAKEVGVLFGGRTDSGDGTHLLIGYGAKGIVPHKGIRNGRFLGPWIEVRADRL